MKKLRKIIEIDRELCDGCGQCILSCAEGALEIVDGKAEVISDNLCDGLGACMGNCPQDALKIIEKVCDDFDEEAVEQWLKEKAEKEKAAGKEEGCGCGCSSTLVQSFPMAAPSAPDTVDIAGTASRPSALAQWPVQIRLVPETAPFLKGADLLVAADCASVASADFHDKFLAGKAVMIGCPKFDDAQSYVEKFTGIFKTAGIKSITVLAMEVPCCAGLPNIVKKAMEKAGVTIPVEEVIIGTRGQVVGTVKS